MESLFGIAPWYGEDIDLRKVKPERLMAKYESAD